MQLICLIRVFMTWESVPNSLFLNCPLCLLHKIVIEHMCYYSYKKQAEGWLIRITISKIVSVIKRFWEWKFTIWFTISTNLLLFQYKFVIQSIYWTFAIKNSQSSWNEKFLIDVFLLSGKVHLRSLYSKTFVNEFGSNPWKISLGHSKWEWKWKLLLLIYYTWGLQLFLKAGQKGHHSVTPNHNTGKIHRK